MSVRIRRADVADAETIAAVHAASWRAAYGDGLLPPSYLAGLGGPRLTAQWQARLRGGGAHDVWVAERGGGDVIGFAAVSPARGDEELEELAGELTMLYLLPAACGAGIGSRLLATAVSALEQRGFGWLVIWVLQGNLRARHFYEQRGLRLDGARRVDQVGSWRVPVVRYAQPLNPVIDYAWIDALLAAAG